MAREAARMICGNTVGQLGSRKRKGRERGNKNIPISFLRNLLQEAIAQKCCSVHGMLPGPQGNP